MSYRIIPQQRLEDVRQTHRFHRRFDHIFETVNDAPERDAMRAHNETYDWVADQFGMSDAERWDTDGYDFGFRDPADAVAFRIRWG